VRPAYLAGFFAEGVNGLIATLAFLVVEKGLSRARWRRACGFAWLLWGFWIVSGTASAFVWLDLPTSLALVNLAFGIPKCFCIAWVLTLLHSRLIAAA
jgi:hypothetical protein